MGDMTSSEHREEDAQGTGANRNARFSAGALRNVAKSLAALNARVESIVKEVRDAMEPSRRGSE